MFSVQDADLIAKILNGEKRAYTVLVQRYEKPLLRFILKFIRDEELARDILQESFLKTYMSLSQFQNKCSFKNWLYKITLNTTRNKVRSLKDMDNIDDVEIVQICTIESGLLSQERLDQLREVVQELPDRQRQAIELRIYQDLSFKEVSTIMDCPYDTAKANYRHGMMKLKEKLESCG